MRNVDFHLHGINLDNQLIVDSCSFSVRENRTSALIGPSGCGKTTMLNVIAGLIDVEHFTPPPDLKLAYIFQEARLIPWLSIEQNLALIEPNLSSSDIKQLLEDVKLHDVASVYPVQLSGGMQRRVSIARAFVNKPNLVLLDEAFSSLDAPTARYLMNLVRGLLDKNQASALLVTHNLQEALALADDLYFLSSKPTKVIKHITNPIPQSDRKQDHLEIDVIHEQEKALLSDYPEILSGIV